MRKLDSKWLLIIVIVVVSITATITMNITHQSNHASQVTSDLAIDNGDTDINWSQYANHDITLNGTLNISQSGTYHLTGAIDDGWVNVNAGAEGVVKLILDNVTIANSTGPAITCTAGDDLVIELIGDNSLSDGATYASTYDADITSAIYSKADLTFTGDGTLTLTANYQDAIASKDDLKFASGTYYITAADDAIRGKDSVYITSGDFTVNAGADGIKSTNETTIGKGFVLIEGGNFNLTTGAKGIKAIRSVIIKDGNYVINSTDDSLHSDNYLGIANGTINLASGDDGIHANRTLVIDAGTLTITKSYEGLEAQVVTINGGDISIYANDDGINAGGGADASATNRAGAGMFDADENCILSINGGQLYVNAAGDGVDSNGWLYFNGGNTTIDGPTNNGNGALDAGMGIVMNGGQVIAVGASGMAESLGSSSSIYNISAYLTTTYPAGTAIEIRDSSGNSVLSHTSAKSFNHISAGSPQFKLGETYSIYLDGENYQDFAISGITTLLGSSTNQSQTAPTPQTMGPAPRR